MSLFDTILLLRLSPFRFFVDLSYLVVITGSDNVKNRIL